MVLIGLCSNPGLASKLDRLRSEAEPSDEATSVKRPPRQRQNRPSEAELAQLVEDRQSGTTIKVLADLYGIHRTTVMNHLARVHGEGEMATSLDPR